MLKADGFHHLENIMMLDININIRIWFESLEVWFEAIVSGLVRRHTLLAGG